MRMGDTCSIVNVAVKEPAQGCEDGVWENNNENTDISRETLCRAQLHNQKSLHILNWLNYIHLHMAIQTSLPSKPMVIRGCTLIILA